ncbi:hypothetical protein SAY87_027557 [Trapa incisa]|uniref:chlorophyllase n=1 Tax=Trapa incisa TaxID=236973 RepID=A0AAN7PK87_9MYRT|nr:hypothetical protein SAY87_027557 [Trapa incisa]
MPCSCRPRPPPTTNVAAAGDVFQIGRFSTLLRSVEDGPPKPLLIASPTEEGEYPVLLLLHGYLLCNSFYSQLLQHVASHGFILVAPQLYSVAGPDSTEEISSTAAVADWLTRGLSAALPPRVNPNLAKLAISGHSRGGKIAFALALKRASASAAATAPPFSALIGIDPVDGMDKGNQTPPPVLTYEPRSFDLNIPVMVIGSGLGEVKKNPLFPPCAPRGVNHEDFFRECQPPACYMVAKDFGHLDMLDDETRGIRGKATYCLCKNGLSREPMRRFVAGAVVAFLKAFVGGDDSDLVALRDGHSQIAPLQLQRIEFLI